MTLPAWLQRTLGDTYRSVRLRVCRRCNAPVLAGLDADICAFAVQADVVPLTPLGEAVALLTGRRTFDLVGYGSDKRLYAREEHNIHTTRRYLVFPEHRCGESLDAYTDPTPSTTRQKLPPAPPY